MFSFRRSYCTKKLIIIKSKSATKDPATTIKSLNYENKMLYGAVSNKKNDNVGNGEEELSDASSKSSEIYWQTKYKLALNFTKKETMTKCRGKNEKKVKIIVEKVEKPPPLFPSSLEKFKDCLVPYPSKINVKEKLAKFMSIDQRKVYSPPNQVSNCPFTHQDLKAIVNFPLQIPKNKNSKWKIHKYHDNKNSDFHSPSVSKILHATMPEASRIALMKWKFLKIAELGEEGFNMMQNSFLERGRNLHSSLECYLNESKVDENVIKSIPELWQSIQEPLTQTKIPAKLVERKIFHPFLHYNGVIDCVTRINSEYHLVEWKTSENLKPTLDSTYDAPLQLCAYLGALNIHPEFSGSPITKGAVIVAYTNGNQASVHIMNDLTLKKYWKTWLVRLHEYWIRYRDKTLPEPI